VAISLGREFTLSIAGSEVAGVRDTTVNETANEITFQPYGSRQVFTYTTGYSLDLSFETIDSAWFAAGGALLESGEQTPVIITDTASSTVWSFNAVVTSISDGQPLDGVRSVQTTLKLYFYDAGSPLRAGDTNP
jgi:hypothetical protein